MNRFLLITLLFICACSDDLETIPENTDDSQSNEIYFPPTDNALWESESIESQRWDESRVGEFYNLLESNGTRAFLLLKDGKIIMEQYFGRNLLGTEPFGFESLWYWASAGKTLTSFVVGKAQEEGYLSIDDPTQDYLGLEWTSLSPSQEEEITIRHHLTMTTGLDDSIQDSDDFSPSKLVFKSDPGERWAYHNAPYTLLDEIVTQAVGQDFDDYFDRVLTSPISMRGSWSWVGNNHVYFSSARDMARYGLLLLNNGVWDQNTVMSDGHYFNDMITPSQNINHSYGYLFWLNGQSAFMLPSSQIRFPGALIPHAPSDMYCGMGKNGQYICVVPSENIVMIRMGENPDQALVPLLFLDDIWSHLSQIIGI